MANGVILICCSIVMAVSLGLLLFRAIKGPGSYNRLLSVNAFGSQTVMVFGLLCLVFGDLMLLDIALIYALINFITTVGILKYIKYREFG